MEDVPGDVPADTRIFLSEHQSNFHSSIVSSAWTSIYAGLISQGYPAEVWGGIELDQSNSMNLELRDNARSEGQTFWLTASFNPLIVDYAVPRGMCGTWSPILIASQHTSGTALIFSIYWTKEADSRTANFELFPVIDEWEFVPAPIQVNFPIGLIPSEVATWSWDWVGERTGVGVIDGYLDKMLFVPTHEGLFIIGKNDERVLPATPPVTESLILSTARDTYVKVVDFTNDDSRNIDFLGQGIRVRPGRLNRVVFVWASRGYYEDPPGTWNWVLLHDVDHIARIECEYTPRWL